MKLTSGDKSFWCFDRAIELYQQRIQWLTENSKKVTDIDFIIFPFHAFCLYLVFCLFVFVLFVFSKAALVAYGGS